MSFWRKNQTQIFLDTTGGSASPTWARLGLSTVLSIDINPSTEDYDFIKDENPTTVVDKNQPTLSQELMCQEGDSCFDYIWEMFYGLKSGSEVETSAIFAFPKASGSTTGSYEAWKSDVTIILGSFDAVARKITFDIRTAGDVTLGKVTVTGGVPTFSGN